MSKSGFAVAAAIAMAAVASSSSAQWLAPQVRMPGKGFFASTARGKSLFAKNCAACHGADLRGSEKGPPLLHPFYKPDHHPDYAFYAAIQTGTRQHHWHFGDMAPVPAVRPDEAGHIIAYVRAEQRKVGLF
ncbi:MAG TPA: cytochrome c [Rhodocyclaceae bacterium]|nr:cytochrome c [Rhodocyclaceae bacterium]